VGTIALGSLVRRRDLVKVTGQWRDVDRAIDQLGQVIDVFDSARRDGNAAHRFFERALGATKITPIEVVTDQAAMYPAVLEALLPAAWHRTDRYANNRVECDHGRLKARLRPMRGFIQDRSARVIVMGHALIQNVRRGHYELAVEEPAAVSRSQVSHCIRQRGHCRNEGCRCHSPGFRS